ncbi:MAG: AMP-binding protein [Muribaculaceae bacterium]|nr:AMP-binding protein [Muribaculaceae bacterium]
MAEITEKIESFRKEWESETPYILAHTSGSTGKPKEIRLPKSDMIASAKATIELFGLNSGSRIAAALSPEFIAGKMMCVRAQVARCTLVAVEPARQNLNLDAALPLNLLAIVPTQIPSLMARRDYTERISNLLVGGSAMTRAQRELLVDSGIRAWESYGMTESCSHVALRRVSRDESLPFEAMPGISFETDDRGCLCVKSENFSWELLRTNDCVELLDEHHFIFKGRADNAIVSGGLKLHPEELEKEYAPAIGEREFYVCGRPDDTWGAVAVLVVEGGKIEGLDKKIASVVDDRRRLPKAIIYKEKLPRTANGKLIRTC